MRFTQNFTTGVKVYNYSKNVWLSYSMCAFILNVFRQFFIQIGYLKNKWLYFYHGIEVLYVWIEQFIMI